MTEPTILIDQFFVPEEAYLRLDNTIRGAAESLQTLGTLVRPIRKRLSWSQEKLAEHIGVPVSRVQKIEKGEIAPSIDDGVVLLLWVKTFAPIQPELPFPTGGVVEPEIASVTNIFHGVPPVVDADPPDGGHDGYTFTVDGDLPTVPDVPAPAHDGDPGY